MNSPDAAWERALGGAEAEHDRLSALAGDRTRSYRRKKRRRNGSAKRRDIQGLRMVAVVAVVVNHLTNHPQGGFVGVDVFFVISGYLITGHLLREDGKSGRISLLDFYRRRVRRLFPAALATICATVIASYLIFDTPRAESIRTDGLAAAGFGANWRLIHTGTDYFTASGPISPLQHYWSLSVEEQFYVVWPLLLIVALGFARTVGRRFSRSGQLSAAVVVGALSAASLVFAAKTHNQVVTYFSTFSRGWELGLGALLAIAAPYVRGRTWLLTASSWIGLAVVGASCFLVDDSRFPYPAALFPCLGAALVVIASSRNGRARNIVLTSRVSNYLGDISYSVYVVHFPIIIFMAALRPTWNLADYIATVLLILAASLLLFHCLENPIRQSRWLRPSRERGDDVGGEHEWKRGALLGTSVGVCALTLLVFAAPAGSNSIPLGLEAGAASQSSQPSDAATKSSEPLLTELQGELRDSLQTFDWPTLSPLPNAPRTTDVAGCGSRLNVPPDCTWGTGSKWIYLVGDSTSIAFTNAYVYMMPHLPGWRLRAVGGSGCPLADKLLNTDPGNEHVGNCLARNAQIVAEINRVKPAVVVVTAKAGKSDQIASQYRELEKVRDSVGTFVVLPPNAAGKDPAECYNKFSTPADCVVKIGPGYTEELAGYRKLAALMHAIYIDPRPYFCVSGLCPEFVGHTPIRRDGTHITEAYSKLLGPPLLEALREHNVFGR